MSVQPPRHMKQTTEPGPWVREQVITALYEAWADGMRFTIHMDDSGVVTVKKSNNVIQRYDDAGQAIRSLFPDKAGMT